jgi:hypothetical protein
VHCHSQSGFLTAGLLIVEVLFVGAPAIFADLIAPAATEHLLFALVFARFATISFLVRTPLGVFIDQDSFYESHLLSSFHS